jgi:DNA-binding NarL/FixJ family response regulator
LHILLVDNHAVVREGICALIDREEDLVVVGQAATAAGAAALTASPDVIVADVELPDALHEEVVVKLSGRYRGTPILVLTIVDHPPTIKAVLTAGARGYLLKTSAAAELLEAIRALGSGHAHVQAEVHSHLERWQVLRDAGRELTAKEESVLRLLAKGYTNAEIATLSGVSRRTIESHRGRIGQKLGLATRAELYEYARSIGLID